MTGTHDLLGDTMLNKSCPLPDCPCCKHMQENRDSNTPLCCKAFPDGIPYEYLFGPVNVRGLAECANGYKYEEIGDNQA